ncbi:hypothetical protein NIASO_12520 [Niabella soli DSM 19437]|uniref:Uncharacterized protein n=1 Tax=Niabella soli DSM 19437 TaxID=929713 RepID=W0F3Y3_9BACT|nr:hypothetical protein NIASO_12520 [Niabella soli DSM 19437]
MVNSFRFKKITNPVSAGFFLIENVGLTKSVFWLIKYESGKALRLKK